MSKLNELILTFFYFGKFPKIPGTVGSAVTIFFWLALTSIFCGLEMSLANQNIIWTVFLVIAFFYGSLAIPTYQKQFKLKQIDHKTIVLDEVIGQIIALQPGFILMHEYYFSDFNLIAIHLIFSFLTFRFFDITKPSLIGRADRMKSGVGVILDDILAGIAAALATLVLLKLTLLIR